MTRCTVVNPPMLYLEPTTGAVIPPISLATTFAQSAAGVHKVCRVASGKSVDIHGGDDVATNVI